MVFKFVGSALPLGQAILFQVLGSCGLLRVPNPKPKTPNLQTKPSTLKVGPNLLKERTPAEP